MTDAIDDDIKALEILHDHYKSTGKPRILTLYNNLCNMKYISEHGLTEYSVTTGYIILVQTSHHMQSYSSVNLQGYSLA